jgi:ligand-binding sensor domain-containing protein
MMVASFPQNGVINCEGNILSLLSDKNGSLWIGTTDGLIHSERGGVTRYKENQRAMVYTLVEDQEGAVWFNPLQLSAGSNDVFCKVKNRDMTCYGSEHGFLPSALFLTSVRDSSGKITPRSESRA